MNADKEAIRLRLRHLFGEVRGIHPNWRECMYCRTTILLVESALNDKTTSAVELRRHEAALKELYRDLNKAT